MLIEYLNAVVKNKYNTSDSVKILLKSDFVASLILTAFQSGS